MRPTAADADESTPPPPLSLHTASQKRTGSGSGSPNRPSQSHVPTTYFLRSEDEVDGPCAQAATTSPQDSTYGVQSLDSTAESINPESIHGDSHQTGSEESQSSTVIDTRGRAEPLRPLQASGARHEVDARPDNVSPDSSPNVSPPRRLPGRLLTAAAVHGMLTPLHIHSPAPGTESAPLSTPKTSSLRSLRLSDDDSLHEDTGSQAVTSSGEEEDDELEARRGTGDVDESAPQLVMPSIKMPTRRPFTERGKNIGKLKIMVVGKKGAGKTSLIRSIVQLCEDIVHVDSHPSSTQSSRTQASSEKTNTTLNFAQRIAEIHASTRAFPSWWSDIEDSWISNRRKGSHDPVLERNICFIDTPSLGETGSTLQNLDGILAFIDGLFMRNRSFVSFSESELLSILSGSGGVQVDVLLYLVSALPETQAEQQLLKSLCERTNVIPVVAKADGLTEDELSSFRASANSIFLEAGIKPFNFGQPLADVACEPDQHATPFAVSSALSSDDDNMDASLLMSPDYVQPIVPSDLPSLVSRIFEPNTASWLRHSSSKKFIAWLRNLPVEQPLHQPSLPFPGAPSTHTQHFYPQGTSPSLLGHGPSGVLVSYTGVPGRTGAPEAQQSLARWASDLQRSMRNERTRFEARRRGQDERARWLVSRLDEAEADALAKRSASMREPADEEERELLAMRDANLCAYDVRICDPLGILEWDERVRRGGLAVVKVLGGCSVVGFFAVWCWRWFGSWGDAER